MGPRTFVFTLVVDGVPRTSEAMLEQVRTFGLEDTVIERRGGLLYFSFVREAQTPEAALDRAIAEIELSVSRTRVVKVLDDLLTIEEVGRRVGLPGGLLEPLSEDDMASFPAPEGLTHSGTRLWRWSQVWRWLMVTGQPVFEGIGEPLPTELIYERNRRFDGALRVADEPLDTLKPPERLDPAESAAAQAVDAIFDDLQEDPFRDLDADSYPNLEPIDDLGDDPFGDLGDDPSGDR